MKETLILAAALLVACNNNCNECEAKETQTTSAANTGGEATQAPTLKELAVADAAGAFAEGATPVDANRAQVRADEGVIKGALLLTSSRDYALTELPANKDAQLVFYCYNHQCTASDAAAAKAKAAGYSNVSVLRAGITGWKEAGQAVETVPSN